MRVVNRATTDREFLGALERWIREQGEVLVLIRYPYAGGAKSFELFSSFQDLSARLEQLESRTSVVAFRQQQLPLRGTVDDDFIARCLTSVADGEEHLIVDMRRREHGSASWVHYDAGVSHVELRNALEDLRGACVAAGRYPPWLTDCDDVISALVPDADGRVVAGAY